MQTKRANQILEICKARDNAERYVADLHSLLTAYCGEHFEEKNSKCDAMVTCDAFLEMIDMEVYTVTTQITK